VIKEKKNNERAQMHYGIYIIPNGNNKAGDNCPNFESVYTKITSPQLP